VLRVLVLDGVDGRFRCMLLFGGLGGMLLKLLGRRDYDGYGCGIDGMGEWGLFRGG
jgi:hypothetical protein